MSKMYTVIKTQARTGTRYTQVGTIQELVEAYSYTLECGASYSHEKGRAKINRNPKTIESLISNLNKAVNNSAANGYAGITFVSM